MRQHLSSFARMLFALLMVLAAAPAFAQGPYVGASVGADIARFSSGDSYDNPATGEALSWALRVGAPIGSRFGVELEMARPEKIENNQTPDVRILGATTSTGQFNVSPSTAGVPFDVISQIFPPISISVRTAQRNTTLGASAWGRQEVSRRFSMVYLGGIAFYRIEQEFEYSYLGVNRLIPTIVPQRSRLIQYEVGPMVGVEARVGMSDHVRLVPGVRLLALQGGWIVRPAVGIAWEF